MIVCAPLDGPVEVPCWKRLACWRLAFRAARRPYASTLDRTLVCFCCFRLLSFPRMIY